MDSSISLQSQKEFFKDFHRISNIATYPDKYSISRFTMVAIGVGKQGGEVERESIRQSTRFQLVHSLLQPYFQFLHLRSLAYR